MSIMPDAADNDRDTYQVGDRVAYLGNDLVELGTITGIVPGFDGGSVALKIQWDDGLDDEGYWSQGDSDLRRVKP